MITEWPGVKSPDDENATIWRYIDFAKLVDMLDQSTLHFASLRTLEDPYEGVPSEPALTFLREHEQAMKEDLIAKGIVDPSFEWPRSTVSVYETWRQIIFTNCWHMNNVESLAMWQLYAPKGIAIRSTIRHLKASLRNAPEAICVGEVSYGNRDDGPLWKSLNAPTRTFFKLQSYDFEREVRAATMLREREKPPKGFTPEELKRASEEGIPVRCDLNILISAGHVGPKCPDWFKSLVDRTMRRYGHKQDVVTSPLRTRPKLT
jgi:hypothetical protein